MNSWNEFITMGGYGLYVWGSLGMVLVCLGIELTGLQARFKSLVSRKRR